MTKKVWFISVFLFVCSESLLSVSAYCGSKTLSQKILKEFGEPVTTKNVSEELKKYLPIGGKVNPLSGLILGYLGYNEAFSPSELKHFENVISAQVPQSTQSDDWFQLAELYQRSRDTPLSEDHEQSQGSKSKLKDWGGNDIEVIRCFAKAVELADDKAKGITKDVKEKVLGSVVKFGFKNALLQFDVPLLSRYLKVQTIDKNDSETLVMLIQNDHFQAAHWMLKQGVLGSSWSLKKALERLNLEGNYNAKLETVKLILNNFPVLSTEDLLLVVKEGDLQVQEHLLNTRPILSIAGFEDEERYWKLSVRNQEIALVDDKKHSTTFIVQVKGDRDTVYINKHYYVANMVVAALLYEKFDLVKFLLERGANVNSEYQFRITGFEPTFASFSLLVIALQKRAPKELILFMKNLGAIERSRAGSFVFDGSRNAIYPWYYRFPVDDLEDRYSPVL